MEKCLPAYRGRAESSGPQQCISIVVAAQSGRVSSLVSVSGQASAARPLLSWTRLSFGKLENCVFAPVR